MGRLLRSFLLKSHSSDVCTSFSLSLDSCLKSSFQHITRDIEIKNNVTIARGEWGGDSGERGL